jgi:hypothetical protein
MLAWARQNPTAGRLVVKLALGLACGLGAGLVLGACGLDSNVVAIGAAAVAVVATRVAGPFSDRLGIPER